MDKKKDISTFFKLNHAKELMLLKSSLVKLMKTCPLGTINPFCLNYDYPGTFLLGSRGHQPVK
jgi:hypothetical protein